MTSCRLVLFSWLAACLSAASAFTASASSEYTPRNILFLMCDSMDGRLLDPSSELYGAVEMPNLRRLAQNGVNFVRTYAASPQCVPSRTSMFTGRRTHEIKAWNNGQGLAAAPATGKLDQACLRDYDYGTCTKWKNQQKVNQTLLDVMRRLDFEPHLYGKVDVGAGILSDTDETNATCDGFHNGPSLPILTRSADIRKATKADPLQITNDNDNNVHPEDWKMLPKCIEFIERVARGEELGGDGNHWLLYCSINIPHPAFQTNATWLSYVNDNKVAVPKVLPREIMHPADSYMSISKSVWRNFTDDEILKVRKTYLAMCAETDYMLGEVIAALDRAGLRNDTVIIFLSDHGEMNMEHRQVWKNSMKEASARVPLVVSGPGMRSGAVVTELTSLLDVLPTLVTLGGGRVEDFGPLSGVSLLPLLLPQGPAEKERAFFAERTVDAEYHSNMGNTGTFMVRGGKWKLITYGTALPEIFGKEYTDQLFDLVADPNELRDVAAENLDVVAQLKGKLKDVIDYQAVDARAKANDYKTYKRFFGGLANEQLRNKFEKAYAGFDDEDWKKIQLWQQLSEAQLIL